MSITLELPQWIEKLPLRQSKPIRRVVFAMLDDLQKEQAKGRDLELKVVEWEEPVGAPLVFLYVETGYVGDEETKGELYNRDRRHLCFTRGGGIKLLNAKTKKKSRGYLNALYSPVKY